MPPCKLGGKKSGSGERGIRTPGPVTVNGFQDRRIRPLCHLSAAKVIRKIFVTKSILIVYKVFFQPTGLSYQHGFPHT